MSILVTGENSSLGLELKKIDDTILLPSIAELDLTKKDNIQKFFEINDIDIVIHNHSLLNVRMCEEQKSKAMEINVSSTQNLVDVIELKKLNVKFFHISTPCIFDGKTGMYVESSIPYPVNFYGLTRLMAEIIVKKLKNYCIVRTNYVTKTKWPYQKAFVDRFGTYLFVEQVAEGIFDLQKENISGVIHLVGDRKISMFDLAKLTTPDIKPMIMKEYFGPPLTMDMSLDTKKWKKYSID